MSTTNIIIGIVLGLAIAGVMITLRNRPRDVYSALLVVGIAALAITVTIIRVNQYQEEKASENAVTPLAEPATASGASAEPPPHPPVAVPVPSPGMRGATGSAAPAAARNPYLGQP